MERPSRGPAWSQVACGRVKFDLLTTFLREVGPEEDPSLLAWTTLEPNIFRISASLSRLDSDTDSRDDSDSSDEVEEDPEAFGAVEMF